jgi:hypothetical protein
MADSVLENLVKVEKAILGALGELADTASDAVVAGLNAAASAVRTVIESVTGE